MAIQALVKRTSVTYSAQFRTEIAQERSRMHGRIGHYATQEKAETSGTVRTHVLGQEVFSTDQVAHDLNISVCTVLRAIHSGKLKARKAGKQYLMTRTAIREYWDGLPETGQESSDTAT